MLGHVTVILLATALLFSWTVYGQVYSMGQCPDPPVQPYFDISKYTGRWYEIERFLFLFELGSKCITSDFSLLKDGDIKVDHKALDIVFGSTIAFSGTGHSPDPEEPAKLSISFTPGIELPFANYKVLDTDYVNYSVVYNCNNLLVAKLEFAWILSRTNSLPPDVISKIYRKLAKLGINSKHFRSTDHSKCYEAEDNRLY